MKNTKTIFVLSHRELTKEFPYDKNIHVRVQCGSHNNRLDGFDFYDDSEENLIRDKNWCFSEATGINAIMLNKKLIQNSDYCGFCHYRRYLDFDDSELKNGSILCHSYELRIPIIIQYNHCHPLQPLKSFVNEIKRHDTKLHSSIVEFLNTSDILYMANCFVSDKQLIENYSEFVNTIIPLMNNVVEECVVDVNGYDIYQRRFMSFIFERMTSFWIWNMQNRGICISDVPLIKLEIENKINSID